MYGENKLIAAVDVTLPLLQELTANVASLIDKLGSEKEALAEINTLESALSVVSDTLQAVELALDIIDVVPDIGDISLPFSEGITLIQSQVSEASHILEGVSLQVGAFVASMGSTITQLTQSMNSLGLEQQSLNGMQPQLNAFLESTNRMQNEMDKERLLQEFAELSSYSAQTLSQLDGEITSASGRAAGDQGKLRVSHLINEIQGAVAEFNQSFGFSVGVITDLKKSLESITITLWVPGSGDQTVTLYQVFTELADIEGAIERAMQPIISLVERVSTVIRGAIPQIPVLVQIENIVVPQDIGFSQLQYELVEISERLNEITTGFNQLIGQAPANSA